MQIVEIAEQITKKIKAIEKLRKEIRRYAKEKAEAISKYELTMAKTIIRLKNGDALEVEGFSVENPPATLIEKIAKGFCYKEKLASELTEANYKGIITAIHAVESELNGYQSIFRSLDTEV